MNPVMGVDPGVRGGLVVLNAENRIYHAEKFQPGMTHGALVDAVGLGLSKLAALGGLNVFDEKVGYMPGDGGQGANTFGRVDGLIRGAVLMWIRHHGGQLHDVAPMVWQSRMGCLTGGNKNVTKQRAQEIWPLDRWTHAISDAALIARYGQLVLERRAAASGTL